MIQSGIYEDTGVIPSARLDTNGLMNETVLGESLICNRDSFK